MSNGETLLRKAEKALQSGGLFNFTPKEQRLENAAEAFNDAANAFKMDRDLAKAGQTYEREAAVRTEIKQHIDAANALNEAFKCYRQTAPVEAARVLEASVAAFREGKNARRAAAQFETLAKLYEELGETERARTAYQQAGTFYRDENQEATANKSLLKYAELSAIAKEYYDAIAVFEDVAKSNIANNLLRFSVKDHLFKAGVCHLATNDIIGAGQAFQRYAEIDKTFLTTREYALLQELKEAIEVPAEGQRIRQSEPLRLLEGNNDWKNRRHPPGIGRGL
ncbi:vesicular-fusion protein sec17 [Trichodelitschia bisporula]|uniref:Vesicular-fusion protein sec17 n=1 Tax=Trichodelitschia bisporula TaxID=703511 RepID=A0A6G1IAS8_9PEZI|nr:vesicular-fusion protein sec17 [Trichodelitschia bisporula]